MSTATLFVVGILFVWLAVTGRAAKIITAVTGGQDAAQTAGQSLPGVIDPTFGQQPIGMPAGFTGPAANPYAPGFTPPTVVG